MLASLNHNLIRTAIPSPIPNPILPLVFLSFTVDFSSQRSHLLQSSLSLLPRCVPVFREAAREKRRGHRRLHLNRSVSEWQAVPGVARNPLLSVQRCGSTQYLELLMTGRFNRQDTTERLFSRC